MAPSAEMTPKLVGARYTCHLRADREIKIIGLSENNKRIRAEPDSFITIIQTNGQPPRQFETETLDGAITQLANFFSESEETVRQAVHLTYGNMPQGANSAAKIPTDPKAIPFRWLIRVLKILGRS